MWQKCNIPRYFVLWIWHTEMSNPSNTPLLSSKFLLVCDTQISHTSLCNFTYSRGVYSSRARDSHWVSDNTSNALIQRLGADPPLVKNRDFSGTSGHSASQWLEVTSQTASPTYVRIRRRIPYLRTIVSYISDLRHRDHNSTHLCWYASIVWTVLIVNITNGQSRQVIVWYHINLESNLLDKLCSPISHCNDNLFVMNMERLVTAGLWSSMSSKVCSTISFTKAPEQQSIVGSPFFQIWGCSPHTQGSCASSPACTFCMQTTGMHVSI